MVDGRLPALGAIVVTLVSCGVAVAAPNQPSASYFNAGPFLFGGLEAYLRGVSRQPGR